MKQTDETGFIFNIQKFSIHDGPGIRTVVFFKGCPLSCQWCANPESQTMGRQVLYNHDNCIGCASCISICRQEAITWAGNQIQIHPQRCIGCGSCEVQCPGQALHMEGDVSSIHEIISTCLQDFDFYEESHGGVTLSGGEVLAQPRFAIQLLNELKHHHIHTVIETTGFSSEAVFQEVVEHVDYLLFDMKHWDEKKHINGTGVSNTIILKNMAWAIQHEIPLLPRIPVIPGYNDSLADAEGFVKALKLVKADTVQLLPFHQFGERKYEMLTKPYAYTDTDALHEEDLQEYLQIFLQHGIHAYF